MKAVVAVGGLYLSDQPTADWQPGWSKQL